MLIQFTQPISVKEGIWFFGQDGEMVFQPKSRYEIDNETAFLRLILSGAVPSTTESLIGELCKTSSRKEFRDVSKILKNSFSN